MNVITATRSGEKSPIGGYLIDGTGDHEGGASTEPLEIFVCCLSVCFETRLTFDISPYYRYPLALARNQLNVGPPHVLLDL